MYNNCHRSLSLFFMLIDYILPYFILPTCVCRYSVDTFQPPVKAETASTSGVSTPAPASESTGLQLPSHPSGSNLSSSSGSQSSGSLSSLDSISSCSSTATLTAGAPTATFDMEDFDEEEHDRDEARHVDDGSGAHLECNAALEEKGCQDRDSGVISLQSARVGQLERELVTCLFHVMEGRGVYINSYFAGRLGALLLCFGLCKLTDQMQMYYKSIPN